MLAMTSSRFMRLLAWFATAGKGVVTSTGKRGVTSNGKAAVFNASGTCSDCCVGDCSCPSGLATSYTVTFDYEHWYSNTTCSGSADESCSFSITVTKNGDCNYEKFNNTCGGVVGMLVRLELVKSGDDCYWAVSAINDGASTATLDIPSGNPSSPVGSYVDGNCFGDNFGFGDSHKITNVSVS